MSDQPDPKRLVEEGYDRIAERYRAWATTDSEGARQRYAALLLDRLPAGAAVLDLGCGSGVPTAQLLAGRFRVTGVDISARQVAMARAAVPAATFLHADMGAIDFPPATWDAVVAFYSIIHLPRAEHAALLTRVACWLRPGGLFVATMGAGSTEAGTEDDWLGTPMYWSHFDSATNRRLVTAAGLRLLQADEETANEDGVPVTFLWVVAARPLDPVEG